MKTPKPKFKLNQSVYAFTKNGLQPFRIFKIIISMTEEETKIMYAFTDYGDYYMEHQLLPNVQAAQKKLEDNRQQLVLLLEP